MMKKFSILILIPFFALFLSGCELSFLQKKAAGLKVESLPEASVFINGEYQGITPFTKKGLKEGDCTLKLVPRQGEFSSWEKQIKLVNATETIVIYHFAEKDNQASYQILHFEPLADKKKAVLAISAQPEGVIVKIDNETKGFTPLSVDNLSSGEHTLTLSSPGFEEKSIRIRTESGYKLILTAQLAQLPTTPSVSPTPEATASAQLTVTPAKSPTPTKSTPSPTKGTTPTPSKGVALTPTAKVTAADLPRPYVLILKTDTGWLRVRSSPIIAPDNEIAKVNPGEKYKLLKSESGWYQIEYQTGKDGWISGKYAEKFE